MANNVTTFFKGLAFYALAFFNLFLFVIALMRSGLWFKKDTEQDKLQYAIGMCIQNIPSPPNPY